MSTSTVIKSIQDIMRKDAGADGDAQRIGQLAYTMPPSAAPCAPLNGRGKPMDLCSIA